MLLNWTQVMREGLGFWPLDYSKTQLKKTLSIAIEQQRIDLLMIFYIEEFS